MSFFVFRAGLLLVKIVTGTSIIDSSMADDLMKPSMESKLRSCNGRSGSRAFLRLPEPFKRKRSDMSGIVGDIAASSGLQKSFYKKNLVYIQSLAGFLYVIVCGEAASTFRRRQP